MVADTAITTSASAALTDDVEATTNSTATTTLYINTTMTQNYIASSVRISHPKLCEIKGRSILHENVQIIQNHSSSDSQSDDTTGIPIRIGRYCHIQSNTILQSTTSDSNIPIRYFGIDDDDDDAAAAAAAAAGYENKVQNVNDSSSNPDANRPVGTVVTATATSTIGSYTMIGHNCIISINHLTIGNQVLIGDHVTIGNNVTIKDNCIIESCTMIPPYTIIPPFTYCYNSNHSKKNVKASHDVETTQESDRSSRRHVRLVMDVAALPPSMTPVRQELAMMTYNTLARQQKVS
jgi:carbonic anhydrase/acetyltransferase-like protein (isoleucine patch superfamily)